MSQKRFEGEFDAVLRTQKAGLWIGPPGVGKTASILATCRRHGYAADIVLMSLREPQDVIGWPLPSQGEVRIGGTNMRTVHYAPPAFAARAATSEVPYILVLDELSCATPSQQALALRIINEYVIGELELDRRRVGIMALCNPPEQAAGGFELSLPMATRLVQFKFEADQQDFVQSFPGYWGEPPVIGFDSYELDPGTWGWARSMIAGFLKSAGPSKLHTVPEDNSQWSKPSPNPRAWDGASRMLAYIRQSGQKIGEATALMHGCVGDVAIEAAAWIQNKDLRDPEEILEEELAAFGGHGPETSWRTDAASPFLFPSRGDVAYAMLSSLAQAVAATMKAPTAEEAAEKVAEEAAGKSKENVEPKKKTRSKSEKSARFGERGHVLRRADVAARAKAMWRILFAAAGQGGKDVAASAAVDFFKECVTQKTRLNLPKFAEELQPFIPFLRSVGQF